MNNQESPLIPEESKERTKRKRKLLTDPESL